jgi:hypothetical protein
MNPSSLQSQLRYRQKGYAWARRLIAGITVCLLLLVGLTKDDLAVSSTAAVDASPPPIVAPAEPQCPGDQTPTAGIRIITPNVYQIIFGR